MSLNETLIQYEQLKSNISELELPKTNSAKLVIKSEVVGVKQLQTEIEKFSAKQGWVLYSDELVISSEIPTKTSMLEAQFVNNANDSLQIKLQQGENYLVTLFQYEAVDSENQFYTDQKLMVRNNLKDQAISANYRLWWQLESEGVNEGRWLPLAQQFIGFNSSNNKDVK